jgi:hypothetical protein
MAAIQHRYPVADEGRFRIAARMLVATLRMRPELHRVGALVVAQDGCRMLAADRGRSTADVWDWLVQNAENIVRDRPHVAALVVPTIDGEILPTPWLDAVARYELNVWIVDGLDRWARSVIDCASIDGSLRVAEPRPERGRCPLDSVASLLSGVLSDGPTRPAPALRLLAG